LLIAPFGVDCKFAVVTIKKVFTDGSRSERSGLTGSHIQIGGEHYHNTV